MFMLENNKKYIHNIPSIFVDEKNNNFRNKNEKDIEINCKQMKDFINSLPENYKSYYNAINIFNTLGIIYIISVLYLKALKTFKKKI